MTVTTMSSRDFNQDIGRAKRAAKDGPVIITDRGKPSHVLLSLSEYQRLTGQTESLVDRLGLPDGVEDVDLDLPVNRDLARAADFS